MPLVAFGSVRILRDSVKRHGAFEFLDPFSQMHDFLDCQIPKRETGIFMSGLRAHCHGETVRSTTNDFQGKIGLMAVHADKDARVDFIMPDRKIRMIGIDFDFGIDLGILRPVVGHRESTSVSLPAARTLSRSRTKT